MDKWMQGRWVKRWLGDVGWKEKKRRKTGE